MGSTGRNEALDKIGEIILSKGLFSTIGQNHSSKFSRVIWPLEGFSPRVQLLLRKLDHWTNLKTSQPRCQLG
jgi:hypothetical protein